MLAQATGTRAECDDDDDDAPDLAWQLVLPEANGRQEARIVQRGTAAREGGATAFDQERLRASDAIG